MSPQDVARLRLIRSENIGPITYHKLVRACGSAAAALEQLPEKARKAGKPNLRICSVAAAQKELQQMALYGARPLCIDDADYPATLAATADAPPFLTCQGDFSLLQRPMVAIVGARNASAAGLQFAAHLAQGLGRAGYAIVSGMALGIDGAAHQGALHSGTIAVLAHGIDRLYPRQHEKLKNDIAAQGLLLSEMPFGQEPRERDFLRRNRIIAGLALGVVVIDAAEKSGSLHTARMAQDYGRDVMAVPGAPFDLRARGTNRMIREGARLVQSVDDVLEELRQAGDIVRTPDHDYRGPSSAQAAQEPSAEERKALFTLLSHVPTAVDELIRLSALSPMMVQAILIDLELAGLIHWDAGGPVLAFSHDASA